MNDTPLEKLLSDTFENYRDVENPEVFAQDKAEFVFHMTDWIEDLEKLAALYKNPKLLSSESAHDAIFGFLVHAVPHLNAAGRLMLGEISDPFAPAKQERQ
jgi:hypothetical protein